MRITVTNCDANIAETQINLTRSKAIYANIEVTQKIS
jgi:hypothetical protein